MKEKEVEIVLADLLKSCMDYDEFAMAENKYFEIFEPDKVYKFILEDLESGEKIEVEEPFLAKRWISFYKNMIAESLHTKVLSYIEGQFIYPICALLRIAKKYPMHRILKMERVVVESKPQAQDEEGKDNGN